MLLHLLSVGSQSMSECMQSVKCTSMDLYLVVQVHDEGLQAADPLAAPRQRLGIRLCRKMKTSINIVSTRAAKRKEASPTTACRLYALAH